MDEATLERVLRRQDRHFATSRPARDALLGVVATLGRMGPGVALGLIADGVRYVGAVGPPGRFVDSLTDATKDALGPAFDDEPEIRQSILDGLATLDTSLSNRLEDADKLLEQYGDVGSVDDIPLADVADYFRAARDRTTIDLHDVYIYDGSADPIQVSDVRLRLDRISAWWPAKAQGLNVDYNFDSPDTSDV